VWITTPLLHSSADLKHELYFTKSFIYNINMKVSSVIKYRNLFILVATFWVLCLSPLTDMHLEGSIEMKSYIHGREHNETIFSMLIHELLFTHLQHTLDHITLGLSHRTFKANKSLSSKGPASSSYPQAVCYSNSQTIAVHLSKSIELLHENKRIADTYSREFSGLSPPTVFS
jgi:hypothetical protein